MAFKTQDAMPGTQRDASSTDLRHIAVVVKAAREAHGLTQRQLAARVTVSPGLIGQIETSRTRPSVSTLLEIARVLGLSLDALFRPVTTDQPLHSGSSLLSCVGQVESGRPPSQGGPFREDNLSSETSEVSAGGNIESHVVRSDEREKITLEGGVEWELLTPQVDHKVSFMLVVYPPRSTSSSSGQLLRHDDDEYFYLIEGALLVRLGFEETTLYPGDAMSFDSSRPHRFENPSNIQAVGIWAVTRKTP
jgi:DNA-binding XRE family transcriptional regulator/mannose-6-phosphate isomerase-like protein (cupin superfamily)